MAGRNAQSRDTGTLAAYFARMRVAVIVIIHPDLTISFKKLRSGEKGLLRPSDTPVPTVTVCRSFESLHFQTYLDGSVKPVPTSLNLSKCRSALPQPISAGHWRGVRSNRHPSFAEAHTLSRNHVWQLWLLLLHKHQKEKKDRRPWYS
jgi:hypothetical protein